MRVKLKRTSTTRLATYDFWNAFACSWHVCIDNFRDHYTCLVGYEQVLSSQMSSGFSILLRGHGLKNFLIISEYKKFQCYIVDLISRLFLYSNLEYASHYLCQQCHEPSTWFALIITATCLLLIIIIVTIINDTKPCAWLMALLTKIMRCILQVRAQEQP